MGIFDVNYTQFGNLLLPPDKRMPAQKSWVKVLLTPIQWLRDLSLGIYRQGATYNPYINVTTYAKGERIIYRYSVYESIVNSNVGNDPLNTAFWYKVQENFIGTDERIKYNGHVLVLTYALNRYFGTTFRQPSNVSDIYLVINTRSQPPFIVGGSESNSSVVTRKGSAEVIINGYSFETFVNMTIWVPLAVYNALDNDPANREQIIRTFADKYVVAGITYSVKTY